MFSGAKITHQRAIYLREKTNAKIINFQKLTKTNCFEFIYIELSLIARKLFKVHNQIIIIKGCKDTNLSDIFTKNLKYTIQERRRNKRTGKKAKNQPNSAGLLGQGGKQKGKQTRGTSRTRLVF